MRRRGALRWTAICLLLLVGLASPAATASDEPASGCYPPCRTGYFCRAGKCMSLCNPPCPDNQRCTPKGECVALSAKATAKPRRHNYFGVFGGYRPGLNDSAISAADVRLEFGGRYMGMQIGPAFGDGATQLRWALFGHIPFRIVDGLPLYLVPTVALGYTYAWLDDPDETRMQDFFISPGLRVRYDPISRLALFLNLIEVEVNFLRLSGNRSQDFKRVDTVPVLWTLSAGVAFLH